MKTLLGNDICSLYNCQGLVSKIFRNSSKSIKKKKPKKILSHNLKQALQKEEIKMANKCIKMCSILLHYQLHENVNMKRTDKDDEDVEQLELSYTAVDIYIDIINLKN